MDEPFDRRRSRVVVGGVEEHGPLRLAICGAREGVRGERAESLYVVRVRGEQGGDYRAGRLSFGKRPDHLPALVEPERVRGVNYDLVLEQALVLCDQLLGRVEPDGEDDGVGLCDRLFDRGGARELTKLLRERCCIRFVLSREDDRLAAADEMPRQRSTDLARSDDS